MNRISNNKFEKKISENMLNYYDLLHGGEAFKIMDSTAGYISREFVKGKTVTKAAKEVVYHNSSYLGETIISQGEIIKVGRTSMEVYVENRIRERDNILITSGTFVMVSVDNNFKPKEIRKTSKIN